MHQPVFFLSETPLVQLYLRRYGPGCTVRGREYCDASVPLSRVEMPMGQYVIEMDWPHEDPLWPKRCEHCGRVFRVEDDWQVTTDRIYTRGDTGEEVVGLRHPPVGAVWDAWWYSGSRRGADGRYLICETPGGQWSIDSRASNCTMPEDNEHRCWVRHGKPEDGTLHVDKNGLTCAAGAGSIMARNWHGYLHNGALSENP